METIVTLFQAYCFCGEKLLGQDQCGEAIRALQESQACEYQSLIYLLQYNFNII
jgi:hypothetical protein